MTATILLICAGALLIAILLGLWRVIRGPSLPDRILAFDLVSTCAVGGIVLWSVWRRTPVYLEAVLIVSLLGFLTTVAFTLYLRSPHPTSESTPSDTPSPTDS